MAGYFGVARCLVVVASARVGYFRVAHRSVRAGYCYGRLFWGCALSRADGAAELQVFHGGPLPSCALAIVMARSFGVALCLVSVLLDSVGSLLVALPSGRAGLVCGSVSWVST